MIRNKYSIMNIKALFILTHITAILILTACNQQSSNNLTVSDDTISAPLPSALLTVDETTLIVELVVDNGSPQTCANLTVDQINGTYSCSINVPVGQHSIELNFSLNDPIFGIVPVATVSSINIDVVSGQTATADFSLSPITYRDDDNDGANNISEMIIGTNPLEMGDTHGVDPLTPITSSPSTISVSGSEFALSSDSIIDLTFINGFDGDISFDTTNLLTLFDSNFILANASMNITNIKRTSAADLSCTDGTTIKITEIANFESGVVETTGSVNGDTLSCTSNFATVLPSTLINNPVDANNLLIGWGSDDDTINAAQTGLLSTTCPQNDALDNLTPLMSGCTGSILENYSVTDDNFTTHNLSKKVTLSTRLTNSTDGLGSLFITGPGSTLLPNTFFSALAYTEQDNSLTLRWSDSSETVVTVFINPDGTLTGIVFVDNEITSGFFTAINAVDGVNTIVSSDSIEFNLVVENDDGSGNFIAIAGVLVRP